MASTGFPSIPEPQATVASHQEVLVALKEAVDLLTKQRRADQNALSAVLRRDLATLTPEDVPGLGL